MAVAIGVIICAYEAFYPDQVRKRDNRDRFEEYKKRYNWNRFNTDELLHESDPDESVMTQNWWEDELDKKRDDTNKELITG